ncbi:MAG TPA: DUF3122 domain-containing protein [Chroococcidiopsis sp.]
MSSTVISINRFWATILPTFGVGVGDRWRWFCRRGLAALWIVGTGLAIASLLLIQAPAQASVHIYPEPPNGVMERSLQTLRDESGQAWQLVLYKRVNAGQPVSLNLRLVGFPEVTRFDHSQPLAIDIGGGELWTAPDVTPTQFGANVGEYDLRPFLEQLDFAAPLHLQLPLEPDSAHPTRLLVPPFAVREWLDVTHWQP